MEKIKKIRISIELIDGKNESKFNELRFDCNDKTSILTGMNNIDLMTVEHLLSIEYNVNELIDILIDENKFMSFDSYKISKKQKKDLIIKLKSEFAEGSEFFNILSEFLYEFNNQSTRDKIKEKLREYFYNKYDKYKNDRFQFQTYFEIQIDEENNSLEKIGRAHV